MRSIKPKVIEFEIYRPPPSTHKLEPIYNEFQDPSLWKPSISYKETLDDIISQRTPAQEYKHRLQNTRAEVRVLQKLEQRWNRHLALWTRSATKIKCFYRGFVCRRAFKKEKTALVIRVEQRLAKKHALELFGEKKYTEAIHEIDSVQVITLELLVLKARIQYCSQMLTECSETCAKVIEMDNKCELGYYLHASSQATRHEFQAAYETMQLLMVNVDVPTDYSYKLKGFLCTKIHPPQYNEAVETFDALLKVHPEDLNAYLQRACLLNCIQEFDRALDDISMVLFYQPQLIQVYALRGRIRCCKRLWDLAKEDYTNVVAWDPSNAMGQSGFEDISLPSETIPLSDEGVIYDD